MAKFSSTLNSELCLWAKMGFTRKTNPFVVQAPDKFCRDLGWRWHVRCMIKFWLTRVSWWFELDPDEAQILLSALHSMLGIESLFKRPLHSVSWPKTISIVFSGSTQSSLALLVLLDTFSYPEYHSTNGYYDAALSEKRWKFLQAIFRESFSTHFEPHSKPQRKWNMKKISKLQTAQKGNITSNWASLFASSNRLVTRERMWQKVSRISRELWVAFGFQRSTLSRLFNIPFQSRLQHGL